MDSPLKGLYDVLPVSLQNLALTGFSIALDKMRYGGEFKNIKSYLEKSQWYSEDELISYQELKLSELIKYCYKHVPYYTDVMNGLSLKPSDICTIDDLQKLPLLSKDDIKNNFSALLSDQYSYKKVKKGHTSGTIGSPLEICYSDNLIHYNYAMLDRQYSWAGVNLAKHGDKVAVIRGNTIVPLNNTQPPFWRYNHYHNQLLLSSFHLKPSNIHYYLDELERYAPLVLDGYPSTVYVLAKYLDNNNQTLKLDSVLTSSETLYDFQREIIEKSFECKIFDYFGSAERVLFTTECENHTGSHVGMEYGITEICNQDGECVIENEIGTIVATSLHNYAMPLIRYKTNDMSAIKKERCQCGRKHPLLLDVTTKAEDMLTLRDGRIISPSVLTHPFKPVTSILESQIIQNDYDNITIKLNVDDKFSTHDKKSLLHGLSERLGSDVNIKLEIVDEIQRTHTGKFKWVISKVGLGI
ncbi:MAG: hypothetical protein AAES65_22090 [Candidatus Thiodiazotropha sp. (ex. Lucinoma kazani)]